METMNYKSLAIPPVRICTPGSTGMSESPGAVTGKLRISSKLDPEHPLAPRAPISRFYTALVTGDLRSLQVLTERYHLDVNLVFEISKNELEWQVKSQASYGLSGLWALEEKRELSTPLCLATRHGHPDCLRHLLRHGADPNLAPGGRGPLHEACQGGHSHCLELLLEYRADPNLRSDQGTAPLHLCTSRGSLRCARLLLRHGAAVELPSEATGDTALHVAARHGLCDHARLYLRRRARVDARNALEETALGILCGRAPGAGDNSLQLFQLLDAHGADVDARDESWRSPLHRACGAANAELVRLLLRRGADANAADYDGVSPLGWALQGAASHRDLRPHLTVQLLLNHGSQKIWPPAFVKVLKSCAAVPEVIEVLFNSYSQIPVSQEWAEAVPQEVFQQHQPFYESILGLAGTARCLQHLCRSAIRANFGSRCHSLIPLLPLPKALRDFLLLEPQGVVL
ncbi:PREDICTED: ankyrin repeat and SOCS box protein 18 [Pseudopodoces humilis]|uniref:ankyrin repeat and SOCS box protein 18 n=1 Tax=Pseudopodoces humilis TaxID=181119 RepID=UPI0006B6C24E|nr:PREDICTED: ankyrin repeat and SOCS box protein 18 [Pseudopodoces humilis]